MATTRHIVRDLARDIAAALAVLALVFLSYSHQPVNLAPQHDLLTATVSASLCGDLQHDEAHTPCHACRIGSGADLPSPCEGQLHLPLVAATAFPQFAPAPHVVAPPDIPDARGPPRFA